MTALESLLQGALELDERERVQLAELILESCYEPAPGWWDSIRADVHERLAAIDAGTEIPVTSEALRSRMYERIRAGASLIQLYSAMVYHGPRIASRIARGLAERVRREGYSNIGEAVGAAV